METSLVLIRHAETVWNRRVAGCRGFLDSPLTVNGRERAARSRAAPSKGKGFHGGLFERRRRGYLETARIAYDGRGFEPHQLSELRERNLGAWEGRLWKDVAESAPDEAITYKKDPSFRPPGGESWHELQARLMAALQQILSAHPGGRVAVFTSGGSLRAAVFGTMSIPPELWSTWATWNTGLSRIDHRDGHWRLVKYNDVGHLSGTGDGRAVF